MMQEIIFKEIIGWDRSKGCATEQKGLLGECKAAFVTVEEQGRKTLHMHFTVWIERIQVILSNLQSHNEIVLREANTQITNEFNRVATTRLFSTSSSKLLRAFQHECITPQQSSEGVTAYSQLPQMPMVVEDQQLRNLRHKRGYLQSGGMFAKCNMCTKAWTYEELVEAQLIKIDKVELLSSFPDKCCRRLEALCVQYQKKQCEIVLNPAIINACYNSHRSHHCPSCFKRSNNKRKQGPSPHDCRHRLPDKKRLCTKLKSNENNVRIPWYLWDGTEESRALYQMRPKRNTFDLFQNVSCKAISESKMTCNSNISIVMPGPLSQYIIKYQTKGNQEEETEEYSRVAEAIRKKLARIESDDSGNIPTERSLALGLLLSASFAHNKNNILGSPMASYLTRTGTRFFATHEFVWCPIRDIDSILQQASISMSVQNHGNRSFFENNAFHYLCRPPDLELLSAFEFFSNYEVVRCTSSNRKALKKFLSNGPYQHPSYCSSTKTHLQGVRMRENPLLVKVSQFAFPDTAGFHGSIFSSVPSLNKNVAVEIEKYSRMVLILFCPLRKESDLLVHGSCRETLSRIYHAGSFPEKASAFLQNLQDARSNCLRCPTLSDELEEMTEYYRCGADNGGASWNADNEDDDDDDDDGSCEDVNGAEYLDQIVDDLDAAMDDISHFEFHSNGIPLIMNFNKLREKGSEMCGSDLIAKTDVVLDQSFIIELEPRHMGNNLNQVDSDDLGIAANINDLGNYDWMRKKTRGDIVLVFSRTEVRDRVMPATNASAQNVAAANGTVASIFSWAVAANLDEFQKTAFEIVIGSFIATFYDEASSSNPLSSEDSATARKFRKELDRLKKLRRGLGTKQELICLLHGAGGSGKSTVIDLVIAYAKEYCELLKHPFTSRTIVVCAMSGVAATLILGETAHSALLLNQQKDITNEQADAWKDTRLLIVDKISFASSSDIEKMESNLRVLMQNSRKRYGGVSVVFSGDFGQLDPIKANPIYMSNCPQFHEWVNCYIELKGMHRFSNDVKWGNMLKRFRNGEPSLRDIQEINNHCVAKDTDESLPAGVAYACYRNRDRDAINTATFEEHCKASANMQANGNQASDAILILSDNLRFRNRMKVFEPCSANWQAHFWTVCGEDDVKFKGSTTRMDPVLKLYKNCPVMLTQNDNVKDGKANGSRAIVERVVLKPGEVKSTVKLSNGVLVAAVLASQVSHLELRHCNSRIVPQQFHVEPKDFTFEARFKARGVGQGRQMCDSIKLKGHQVPVISNTATTGHKLQGSTIQELFVHCWHYGKDRRNPESRPSNWPYVVLSRVRSMNGLHMRDKLSEDVTMYAVPPELTSMLNQFESKKAAALSKDDMEDILRGV